MPIEKTKAVRKLMRNGSDRFSARDWAYDMTEFCQTHKFEDETTTALIKAAEQSVNLRQTNKLTWRLKHLQRLLPENDIEHILRNNPKVLSTENNKNLKTQIRNLATLFPEIPVQEAVHLYPRILTSKWILENEEFYRANLPGLSIGMLFKRLPKLFCLDKQQETLARVDILELFFGNVAKTYSVLNQNPNLLVAGWRFYARLIFIHEHPDWGHRTHEVDLQAVKTGHPSKFAFTFRGKWEYARYMSKEIVKHGDLKHWEIQDNTVGELEELYVHVVKERFTRDKGLEGLGIVDDMKGMKAIKPSEYRPTYNDRAGIWNTNIGV